MGFGVLGVFFRALVSFEAFRCEDCCFRVFGASACMSLPKPEVLNLPGPEVLKNDRQGLRKENPFKPESSTSSFKSP